MINLVALCHTTRRILGSHK